MWSIYLGLFILVGGTAAGIGFAHSYPHAPDYLLWACIMGGVLAAIFAIAVLDRLSNLKQCVDALKDRHD